MSQETSLVPNSISIIDNVNVQQVSATMQKIAQFQTVVQKTLKKDHDYGIIPGTGDKPTLLKPGAEKILMLMGLTSEYEIVEKVQDYENGFFAFTVKCIIYKNDLKITEGVGHANTKEARYARRWVTEKKLPEGVDKNSLPKREKEGKYGTYFEYQIGNDDPYTLANTVLKMAKKRAQVDAVLTVASLSEIFTQDLEDFDINNPVSSRITKPVADMAEKCTDPQSRKIYAMGRGLGMDKEKIKQIMIEKYGATELTKKQAADFIEFLTKLQTGKETWPPGEPATEMFGGEEVPFDKSDTIFD